MKGKFVLLVLLSTMGILLLGVLGIATADHWTQTVNSPELPAEVERTEECSLVTVVRETNIDGFCIVEHEEQECPGPGNTSCVNVTRTIASPCIIGTNSTNTTETKCKPLGYVVNGDITLNTSGYACTAVNDGKIYLTCDSQYDGNGDGICTPGESCIQFGIVGGFVQRLEKNSATTFVAEDQSFLIPRAEVSS